MKTERSMEEILRYSQKRGLAGPLPVIRTACELLEYSRLRGAGGIFEGKRGSMPRVKLNDTESLVDQELARLNNAANQAGLPFGKNDPVKDAYADLRDEIFWRVTRRYKAGG